MVFHDAPWTRQEYRGTDTGTALCRRPGGRQHLVVAGTNMGRAPEGREPLREADSFTPRSLTSPEHSGQFI